MIKRVVEVGRGPEGGYRLRGDNWIESEDSGALGLISEQALVGVVVDVAQPVSAGPP